MFLSCPHLLFVFIFYFVGVKVTANLPDKQDVLAKRDVRSRAKLLTSSEFVDDVSTQYKGNGQPLSSQSVGQDWLLVPNWPAKGTPPLGQVSGVSINSRGEIVIFHRGDRQWGSQTFNLQNVYMESDRGPISNSTVLVFHPESGVLLKKWGESMFYMPHGITVDSEDNLWLTDVALHQVFKFSSLDNNPHTPLLALGTPFKPGNSAESFCKPTSVAVTPSGDFFVADGYCNTRIIKFNRAGVKLLEWGRSTTQHGSMMPNKYQLTVPHALTLVEDRELVCVADRENGRVQCFTWNNGTFAFQLYSPQIGTRLFSVAYSPVQGGLFFVVNGPEFTQLPVPVRGFVISAKGPHYDKVISEFGFDLQNPHDLAVSADAKEIYVGEIGPFLVSKFKHNDSIGPIPSAEAPVSQQTIMKAAQSLGLSSSGGSVLPAVLVTGAALVFAVAVLTAALVYSRAKRRGMSLALQELDLETRKLVDDEA